MLSDDDLRIGREIDGETIALMKEQLREAALVREMSDDEIIEKQRLLDMAGKEIDALRARLAEAEACLRDSLAYGSEEWAVLARERANAYLGTVDLARADATHAQPPVSDEEAAELEAANRACWECRGNGFVLDREHNYGKLTCPRCNGSGLKPDAQPVEEVDA
jgi:hypothetical protein